MHDKHIQFMREAIRLSQESIENGGGPFAAIIVKNNEFIAAASNSVTVDNDPTAHAEVNVIRKAAKKLGIYDLSDCVIYTSCEPCPMCLGAIYWAKIRKVYYGNTKLDAKQIGFDDAFIYDEIELPLEQRDVKFTQILAGEAITTFINWENLENKIEY